MAEKAKTVQKLDQGLLIFTSCEMAVLASFTTFMMKHHVQKQVGEKKIYLTYTLSS